MTDRNQQAREKEQLRRVSVQHKQNFAMFAQDLASGRTALVDRFGAVCRVGDHVLWRAPLTHDLVWKVEDVVPVLDPGKPVGVLRVKLVCDVPAEYIAGMPSMGLIRVAVQPDAPQDAARTTGTSADAPTEGEAIAGESAGDAPATIEPTVDDVANRLAAAAAQGPTEDSNGGSDR